MADGLVLDASEVLEFARDLVDSPKTLERKIHGSLTRHTNLIHSAAMSNAATGRPWLGTPKGIRKDTRTLARRIYSPVDLRTSAAGKQTGAPVGLINEFGTEDQAPQPFMLPAFNRYKQPFANDVGRIVEDSLRL